MISPMLVAKAYAATQGQAPMPSGGAEPAGGSAFADLVKNVMQETTGASRHAEAQMVAHIQGKAELVDVVTAVASAEASLETVMAVRDQVISAYQEIMRMPI